MEPTSRKNILESQYIVQLTHYITMIFNKSLLIYIEFKSSYSRNSWCYSSQLR